MNFRQLKAEDKTLYDKYLSGSETNSESSFANMYAWRNVMNTQIFFDEDNCYFIYTKRDGRKACCFPRGKNPIEGIHKLHNYFKTNNLPLILESITGEEARLISDHFANITITPDEDLFDYVYSGEKLRSLSGKKLHSKRNHINRFKTLYPDYRYAEITPSNIKLCYDFSEKWLYNKYNNKITKEFSDEMNSIDEFLSNFENFNLTGGMLLYNEEIVAFTLGEKLNKNTCVVHIEKADTEYEGAYTMINNLYINNSWPDIEYVNREEDMGIEGIRKAKKSYYPDIMVKKFSIFF